MARRILIGGLSAAEIVLIGLVTFVLVAQFPFITTTGDANLQRWIGPDGARVAFVLLSVLVGAGVIVVAVYGTREPSTERPWMLGAVAGASLGLVTGALYLIADATATGSGAAPAAQVAAVVASLAIVLGPLVLGAIASGATARIGAGAVAGFWFNLTTVMPACIGLIAGDSLFESRLLRTAWVGYTSGDRLCSGVHGTTLVGCAVGDDLGFAATLLIFGPVLGVLLGAAGGAIGRILSREGTTSTSRWGSALRPVLVFSVVLAIVMTAEVLGNLW